VLGRVLLISPATNASSFLAVDSGDEKRVSGESAPPSELGGPDDNSTAKKLEALVAGEMGVMVLL
jgi:hypothetical protein